MYKRKYGKMTVNAWLNSEMERSSPAWMVVAGFLFTVSAIVVRAFVGSPYRTILELGIGEIVPPVWIMTLLWTLSFFTVGCAAGFVLCYRVGGGEGEKYKGGMLFVLLAVLELCWYPTLFGAQLVFLSVLESILILCLAVAVTYSFYRVTKFAGMLLLFHDIWLTYMLILNFSVLFRG
ncbi:MAG: tryptophan-rich sensory protein [Clostridia bacterium]|nr:tryptophan-rich sensory protein [Clostridia bacterium]